MRLLDTVGSRLRLAWFALHGARFEAGCRLEPGVSLQPGIRSGKKGQIVLGHDCDLRRGACLHAWGGRIALGRNVFVGPYAVLYGHGGIEVGDGTLISMHCRVVSADHDIPAAGVAIRSRPDRLQPVRIGSDVWLGSGVTVLAGVTIGDGCVVAAGAVVTRDLPAGTVAMGAPAAVVRSRQPA